MMNPTSQTSSTPQAQQQHNSHQQHKKWESLHHYTLREKIFEEDLIISSSSESPTKKSNKFAASNDCTSICYHRTAKWQVRENSVAK